MGVGLSVSGLQGLIRYEAVGLREGRALRFDNLRVKSLDLDGFRLRGFRD